MKVLLLSILIFSSSILFSQEEPDPVKHLFSVRDLYYTSGITLYGFENGTLPEFRKLAPTSSFLNRDLSNFSEKNGYRVSNGTMISAIAGFNFRNKRKNYYLPSPQVRIGFSYFSSVDITNTLTNNDIRRFDTIVYNGQSIYLDTVFNSRYKMEHHSKQLRLDLSAIFRTDRTKRWSFYGGIGFTLGGALNSYTNIQFHYTTYVDSVDIAGHPLDKKAIKNGKDSISSESITNKNGICYSVYFPMGMDFRVGKRSALLRHIHLFYEMRPGFYYLSIPELRHYRSPGMNFGFGMRIAID